ncbi:MAG: hypothetical protein AVDCRST_MAG18-1429 [uncultured Thermomicrobiales bacterium]|uniref:Uncharacterized protein n=1 Tax=uncultured Thermomicrobiales bacterium TaxID=1645740 RepID=A0A6J4V2E9_9BACT|nr:MAG: hypothetical protein AVDCRST_MAG18-1429 [uncultured Thermomicrobiales bacterium]
MSRTAWQETIDQTQSALREQPDRCFVCAQEVAVDCHRCAVQAFLDEAHTHRLAVVCDRASCLNALADAHNGTWQRLFQALTHWPDPTLYPLGPYWTIRRGQRFALRTAERRTTYLT